MEHTFDIKAAFAADALSAKLAPVAASERIQALDVVRGFALIGIFFMNIEYFNRSFLDFGTGIPPAAHGIDWLATYFVNYFVAGKFWTIFSLLFGMGFAVMLSRAEETNRPFIKPYIRRIIALAIFGFLHNVMLWYGDILLSYAFTAGGLLIVLFGRWKWIVLSVVGLLGFCFIPGMNSFGAVVAGIAYMGLLGLFIRNEKLVKVFGKQIPLFSVLFLVAGVLVGLVALVSWFVVAMKNGRNPMSVMAFVFLLIAFLSARFHQPTTARFWRAGVLIYCMPFLIGTVFGIISYQQPIKSVFNSPEAVQLAAEKAKIKAEEELSKKAAIAEGKLAPKVNAKTDAKVEAKKGDPKVVKTDAQKKIETDADSINNIQENRKKIAEDVEVLSHGTYMDTVKQRFDRLMEGPFNPAGMAFEAIALFLLGLWFVRAKIITKSSEHLALFRQIAVIGLPVGWGLSVLASSIAVSHVPGVSGDGWQLSQMLLNLGNLPTCLAYLSIVVLMLHSDTVFSKIKVLAPFGRMALTNYLMQSLVQASFFYGWGMGYFGLGRAQQLGFAVCVICLQVLFSHWWLARFRYGPLEWVWRAVTYWQFPVMRIKPDSLQAQIG
ncbi:DUF418 domain-containing protein [Undibacterium sp. Di24W]|uniref:DUF418 domain-containing protein n=1 Tax=Undibacterium sp. Di24W TaxID=3413033 RepID=UPI003BF3ADF8